MNGTPQRAALITGAGRGLGLALARALLSRGWHVVVDARRSGHLPGALLDARPMAKTAIVSGAHPAPSRGEPPGPPGAVVLGGDVTDPVHRDALASAVYRLGRLDLLVNNASDLGPSPLPRLADVPFAAVRQVYETNVLAPLALTQLFLPLLRASRGTVLNISSDAAVEAYPGWGAYGSSKAALDQLTAVLAAEEQALAVYSVDPGDMRTEMHQAAFPGEDISDRPAPETVVPALLALIATRPPSGRHRAADLTAAAGLTGAAGPTTATAPPGARP